VSQYTGVYFKGIFLFNPVKTHKTQQVRNSENPVQKMKTIVLLIGVVFALLMSSCTVIVDGNGRPCGIVPQAVHVGMIGSRPGCRPYQPIGGRMIVSGGMVGGLCGPRGPFLQGGIQTFPIQPWEMNVQPYGSRFSPGHPSNFYQGGPAGWNQPFGQPVCQPRPCYNPRTMRR
jgi:hypothetical protein